MSESKGEKKETYFGKVFHETGRIVSGMKRTMDSKVYLYLVTSGSFKERKTHVSNKTIAEAVGVSITSVSNSIQRLAGEAVIRLEYKRIGYDENSNRPITGRIIWILSPRERQYCMNLSKSILTPFLSGLRGCVSNKEEDNAEGALQSGEGDLQSGESDLQIGETDLQGYVSNREGCKESNKESHREVTLSKEHPQKEDSQGHADRAGLMARNDRFVKGKELGVDCCLLGEGSDFGLETSKCAEVLSPYCEVRQKRGWCNSKDDCRVAIMTVVKRVEERKGSIKSYSNYLFNALQKSLSEDADMMKRPRSKSHIGLDKQLERIDDVLKEAGLP